MEIYGHAGIHSENTPTLISLQIRKNNVHMAHSTKGKFVRTDSIKKTKIAISAFLTNILCVQNCVNCLTEVCDFHFDSFESLLVCNRTKRWSWSVRCLRFSRYFFVIAIWSMFGENQIFALFSEKLSVCISD